MSMLVPPDARRKFVVALSKFSMFPSAVVYFVVEFTEE